MIINNFFNNFIIFLIFDFFFADKSSSMSNECDEFKAGFCTRASFYTQVFTKNCTKKHVISENMIPEDPEKVYLSYSKIIEDIDYKIEVTKKLLNEKLGEREEKYYKMIKYLFSLINNDTNPKKLKEILLFIKGCLNRLEKFKELTRETVCEICSRVYDTEILECDGGAKHDSYKKLRIVYEKVKTSFIVDMGN